MRVTAVIILVCLGLASADVPQKSMEKIIGGEVTTIDHYPFAAALLLANQYGMYWQACAGTLLNTRSILTCAHCLAGRMAAHWRIRVGSTFANSGGSVHATHNFWIHAGYNSYAFENDIAIMRPTVNFEYTNVIQPVSIAGTNYFIPDNEPVWAIGWGTTSVGGLASEQMRHVQIWTVNQTTCRNRYAAIGWPISDNMVCSGWLDVGGRDQCQGDSGGPLLHNNVQVGISSFGYQCALAQYPGVNTRVSSYTDWIVAAA